MSHPFLLADWHIMLHCVVPLLLKCMICLPVKEMEATFEMSYFTPEKYTGNHKIFRVKLIYYPLAGTRIGQCHHHHHHHRHF